LLGVDVDRLLISQPDCGEDALSIAEMMIKSQKIGVVVIDSVAALVPRAELDGEMGERHVGIHARLMAQAMRKLAGIAKKAGALVIFTNQIRYKIGVIFGSPETTPGGNSLKFFASMRLDIRVTKQIKDKNQEGYANLVKIKVVKNKLAPPHKLAHTTITYGQGFDTISEFVTLALDAGEIVKKKNSYYTKGGTKMGLGLERTKRYLRKRPEQVEAMREYILSGES
jgi:recombination protein RecA